MPKARKKKVKHQDFAKVKLKVGKKLPRAANETDVSFHSRSIQIKDQFKGDRGNAEPSTRRKLVLGDLLAQCQHYSSSVKHDALVGLRELLSECPHLVDQNLRLVLERTAELFVDKDATVRKDVLRLLKSILPSVEVLRVMPFFSMISAHLCCAMTHINEDIQADSLLVLDLLIENFPELIVTNSSHLLPNFMEQISRESPSNKKIGSRTLTVNPGGKIGSLKWRVRVLERLNKLLRAMVQLGRSDIMDSDSDSVHVESWRSSKGHQPLVNFCHPKHGSGFKLRDDSVVGSDTSVSSNTSSSLPAYAMSLIPLLLDCWIEVGPDQLTPHLEGNVLDPEALLTLQNVLAVLVLLTQYLQSHGNSTENKALDGIKMAYGKDFVRHFMTHFPYAMHTKPLKKGEKSKEDNPQLSVLSINLLVCELMTHFFEWSDPTVDWIDTIVEYLCHQLIGQKQSVDQLKAMLGIIQQIMLYSQTDTGLTNRLLAAVFSLYKNKKSRATEIQIILGFFSDVFLNHSAVFKTSSTYITLLESLPPLLVQVSTSNNKGSIRGILAIMKSAAIQRELCFLSKLEEYLPQLLDGSVLAQLDPNELRHLVEIFYNVPHWSRDNLAALSRMILDNALECDVQVYALESLHQRVLRDAEMCVCPADYVSFLFTVILGLTKEDILKCVHKMKDEVPKQNTAQFFINSEVSEKHFETQMNKAKCGVNNCLLLGQFPNLYNIWVPFLEQILESQKNIPLSVVSSIIYANIRISPSAEQSHLCSLICHLLLDAMITIQTHGNIAKAIALTVVKSCQECLSASPHLWTVLCNIAVARSDSGTETEVGTYLEALQRCLDVDMLTLMKEWKSILPKALQNLLQSIIVIHPKVAEKSSYSGLQYCMKLLSNQVQKDTLGH